MSENLNLSLRFEEARGSDPGRGSKPVARICVDSACSYLKDNGAPVITLDCGSAREFEAEAERLKSEIDAILTEARQRFGGRSAPPPASDDSSRRRKDLEATPRQSASIREDLLVRDHMTRDVRTLKPNDKILIAEELMKVGRFRHIVVVDEAGGEVVGVLSHSDICFNALAWSLGEGRTAHDRLLGTLPVKQVMQNSVLTVRPDAPLSEAARTMAENQISCLPVIDSGRLVGILTAGDFLAMVTGAHYGDDGD